MLSVETCDCIDCVGAENPCEFDCGECSGCSESAKDREEIGFTIDCERGVR